MTILKTGDAIVVTYDGRTVDGTVLIASRNGKSLVIQYEAILGGFVGIMPISMDEKGSFHVLMGEPIGIKKKE